MKKNGFTLVELLAVILILAIIALIAVPQVINLINSSKEKSFEIGIQNYVRAVETAVMNKDLDMEVKNLNGVYNIINDGKKIQSSDNIIDIDYDGKGITQGKVIIKNYKVTNMIVKEDNNYIIYENGEIVYSKSFDEDSWETIALNVKVGNLSKYKVGDTKEIALTGYTNQETDSNGLYTVRIANISSDDPVCTTEGNSQTACGFVVEFEDIITRHNMNPEGEYKGVQYDVGWNVGGYPASSMYTFVNNDIYESLPEDLKEVIIDTKVVSGHGSTSGETNFISTDKLYLFSTKELWGSNLGEDFSSNQTRQLDYYKDVSEVTTNPYSGTIKKYNGREDYWWLRTADPYDNTIFASVGDNGDWYCVTAYEALGVSPAFRIG